MISIRFQGKPFNIIVIKVYAPTSNAEDIKILGSGKLKWTVTSEFISNDHDIYYCGQESFRRNGVAIIVNKSLKCST